MTESINELKSYTEYNVNTPRSAFTIGFPYEYNVDKVHVYVNGVEATTAGYTVAHVVQGTLTLTPAVLSGVVRIVRETDIDTSAHTFSAGAKFTAENMDENFQQIRHSQQEVRDGFTHTKSYLLDVLHDYDDRVSTSEDQVNTFAARLNNEVADRTQGDLDSQRYVEDLIGMGQIWDGISSSAVQDYARNKSQAQVNDDLYLEVANGRVDEAIETWSGITQRSKNLENVSIYDFSPETHDCSSAITQANTYINQGYFKIPSGQWTAIATNSNIASLFAALKKVVLDGSLTIQIGNGTFTLNETCTVSAVNGQNLNIIGVAPPIISITSQVSVSGTAGNYNVTLQVNNASLIEVGNFLHTTDVTGTDCSEIHRGGWEVLSVDKPNNLVTVKNTCWLDTFPTNTITSSTSYVIKSVLKFNNVDAFLVLNSQVFFDNVAIVGNSDEYWSSSNVTGTEKGTHGLLVGALSIKLNGRTDNLNPYGKSISHVSCGRKVVISGFDQQGIVTELNSSFFGDFVSSCNNKRRGFYASTASGIRGKHISANGNFLDGVIADLGGQIYASSSSCACGNGWSGIAATQNGTIIFDTGFVKANKNIGCRAYENGVVQTTSASIQYNLNYGVNAQNSSVIYIDGSTISNHATGAYVERNSSIRATNTSFVDNTLHTRSNTNGYINLSGATYAGGTTNLTVTNGACVEDSDGIIGSDTSFQRLRLLSSVADKFVVLANTSAGNDLAIGFGIGSANEAFHIRDTGTIYPQITGNADCGRSSNVWKNVYSTKFMFTATVGSFFGSGSPEGVVSAGVGSTYHRTDGGAGTSFYVKESGSGTAGWVAK